MRLHGVDFTSAPRARKPITVATADGVDAAGGMPRIAIARLDALDAFESFETWLRMPGLQTADLLNRRARPNRVGNNRPRAPGNLPHGGGAELARLVLQ